MPYSTSVANDQHLIAFHKAAAEANASQFATAAETLAHMELMHSVYGETLLSVWVTADGKHIDSVVLDELATEGLIRRTCSPVLSAYVTPKYFFIP